MRDISIAKIILGTKKFDFKNSSLKKSDESGKNLQWIFYIDTDNIDFIRMILIALYRKRQDTIVIRS